MYRPRLNLKLSGFIVLIACMLTISCAPTGNQSKPQALPNQALPKSNSVQAPAAQTQPVQANQAGQKDQQLQALEQLYQQGYNAFDKKQYAMAIKLEDQVLQKDEKFYKAYNVKGIALCYSNQFALGMKNIDKALALKPDDGYARFNKALALELYGQYDQAIVWYDKALEVEKYVWSYYGKASIYGRRGDVANTVKFLKIAIALDPGVKDVAKGEKDFNPVRSSKEFQSLIN